MRKSSTLVVILIRMATYTAHSKIHMMVSLYYSSIALIADDLSLEGSSFAIYLVLSID